MHPDPEAEPSVPDRGRRRQPLLHDLVATFAAPTQVLASATGDVESSTDRASAQGLWHADLRVLSDVRVLVDGERPEHIASTVATSGARFAYLLRQVGDGRTETADPHVWLDRRRAVSPGEMTEELTLSSVLRFPVPVVVELRLTSDFASMDAVRAGEPSRPREIRGTVSAGRIAWARDGMDVAVSVEGGRIGMAPSRTEMVLTWDRVLPAGGSVTLRWGVEMSDAGSPVGAAPTPGLDVEGIVAALTVGADGSGRTDERLRPWLRQALSDLDGLRMSASAVPAASFFAAGVPWYLTLFGRDSIWTARLLLEVAPELALPTLRTLAHFQGTDLDVARSEAPGKVMHELRRGEFAVGDVALPPRYFGTIDATPLWISLLHDCWRAGAHEDDVRALIPHLQAALGWLRGFGDSDGDGFVEYLDESGQGLANQGWKDSGDSIRFADGTVATGPVALCEVQGYAYEAAVKGAALLDAFGLDGGPSWRTWAADLASAFRAHFWCGEGEDRYPALALDGGKRRVDAVTSNIGHLLGTGLLTPDEERLVAGRLAAPDMDSGLGLRTMSSLSGGYSPLSYHCGSVWPHDTAIAVRGMLHAGLAEHAVGLVEGLLAASVVFDCRLPELWSGEGVGIPYPAACRPQAWSAASAVTVAVALRELGS